MTVREFYALIHSDYGETLRRLGNEKRVRKFLFKFADDRSFGQIRVALDAQNYQDAFCYAHTLKGIALNLGLANLTVSASVLTEALRPLDYRADLEDLYLATKTEYEITVGAIRKL